MFDDDIEPIVVKAFLLTVSGIMLVELERMLVGLLKTVPILSLVYVVVRGFISPYGGLLPLAAGFGMTFLVIYAILSFVVLLAFIGRCHNFVNRLNDMEPDQIRPKLDPIVKQGVRNIGRGQHIFKGVRMSQLL